MPEWLVNIGIYFWDLFKLWITTIFVAPFKTVDMLWLLVPVWISWFFAEFFQEKLGTSMGNAITNAVVVAWGSIDCTRQTIRLMGEGVVTGIGNIIARFSLLSIIFIYGVAIIVLGWKGNKVIKYIGRIREVTYVFAMFVPVFYNEVPLTINHFIATLLFFPIFYFTIELIDRYTPNPKAMAEDLEDTSGSGGKKDGLGGLGGSESSGLDSFGSGSSGKKDDFSDMGDFKL